MNCLAEQEAIFKELITVYNPESDADIDYSEEALLLFLQNSRDADFQGCLVTLGSHFSGMESATVIFVYSNPYASNFREHYMRASVELFLVDRNIRGTAPLSVLEDFLNQKLSETESSIHGLHVHHNMQHETKVRQLLGDAVFSVVLEAVDVGEISLKHAKNIAIKLNPRVHGKLLHFFLTIDATGSFTFDGLVFKDILNWWYEHELTKVSSARLVEVLRDPDINLNPLALRIAHMSRWEIHSKLLKEGHLEWYIN